VVPKESNYLFLSVPISEQKEYTGLIDLGFVFRLSSLLNQSQSELFILFIQKREQKKK